MNPRILTSILLFGCSMSAEEWSIKMATKYCDACASDDAIADCIESMQTPILSQLTHECPYDEDAASACLAFMDEEFNAGWDTGDNSNIEFECNIRPYFVEYTCPVLCY